MTDFLGLPQNGHRHRRAAVDWNDFSRTPDLSRKNVADSLNWDHIPSAPDAFITGSSGRHRACRGRTEGSSVQSGRPSSSTATRELYVAWKETRVNPGDLAEARSFYNIRLHRCDLESQQGWGGRSGTDESFFRYLCVTVNEAAASPSPCRDGIGELICLGPMTEAGCVEKPATFQGRTVAATRVQPEFFQYFCTVLF